MYLSLDSVRKNPEAEAIQVYVACQSAQYLPTESLARQIAEALIHEVRRKFLRKVI